MECFLYSRMFIERRFDINVIIVNINYVIDVMSIFHGYNLYNTIH